MSKPSSAKIEFAKRHLVTEQSTFNAWSAIMRLESLIADVRDVSAVLQPVLDDRPGLRYFEFTAYYKVGYVTCLEWHAKSRLYDLFCSHPNNIKSEDLKQVMSNEKLASMVTEGLTIPHLLAGSQGISSKESYIAAISRVFEAIGAPKNALSGILDEVKVDTKLGEILEQLYSGRNDLVHEIGIQTIGHPNVRDVESFADALSVGEGLLSLICAIEGVITQLAPSNFPNKINEDGYPVSEEGVLSTLILSLEKKIEDAIASDTAGGEVSLADWQVETAKNWDHLNAELTFIDRLDLAGSRYFDVRPFLKSTLLKQRAQYLALLSKQIL